MSRSKSVYVIVIIILLTVSLANAGPYENSRAVAVSGGETHTLVLTADANLWAAGYNSWYHLGIGDDTTDQTLLVQVHGINDVNLLENIISADAGWKHSLAIDINNNVLAWGNNAKGELGNGGTEDSYTPIKVKSGEQDPGNPNTFLEDIVAVSAGRSGEFSLALDNSKHVWSFGFNSKGQLGNGESGYGLERLTPVQVKGGEMETTWLEDIVCISAGEEHSAAVDSNGGVWTWGEDGFYSVTGSGKLGIGPDAGNQTTPVHVLRGEQPGTGYYLQHIVEVSAVWDHTLALEEYEEYDPLKAQQDPNYTGPDPNHQGRVYSWGCNGQVWKTQCNGGQLGDGTYDNASTPVVVHAGEQNPTSPNSALKAIIAVSAGENHSLALDVNGLVLAWGDNAFGQLGNGQSATSTTPVYVLRADTDERLSGIVAIAAGYWHNLAIDADGTIWVWGLPKYGRLALGHIPQELTGKAHPIPLVINTTKQSCHFGIQTAIDDANNGNIIEVPPGTYYENIDFGNKTVTLKSTNPDDWSAVESTIIHGAESSGYGFAVTLGQSQSSHISGFKITSADAAIACSGTALISNCLLTGNAYKGLYLDNNANVEVVNTRIVSNGLGGGDNCAGVYCAGYPSNPAVTLTDCIVSDNGGNGIYNNITAAITNNIISRNKDHGIYSSAYSPSGSVDVTITNNWIYDNGTDGTGDGIYIEFAFPNPVMIRNNTIADNNDYGIRAGASTYANVTNCILWGNSLEQLNNCSATYSCIDIDPVTGQDNINSDPCFAHADANNFHIKPESKCIDNANSALVTDPNETDIDGECRIMDGDFNGTDIVDMGADELYWPKCDYDDSEIVNFVDFTFFANAWHGSNDTIDLDDDSFVDIEDLKLFCNDWLWVAPWSARYEQMSKTPWGMTAGGDGGAMAISSDGVCAAPALPALTSSTTTTAEAEPLSAERIEELIDWTESLLEDEERTLDESKIQKILDSLKAELE